MKVFQSAVVLLALMALPVVASAAEVWNEATDGELSYDVGAPTDLGSLPIGTWEVVGSVELGSLPYLETFDYVRFTTEGPWNLDIASLSLSDVAYMGISVQLDGVGPDVQSVTGEQLDVYGGIYPAGSYILRTWLNGSNGSSDYSVRINVGTIDIDISASGARFDDIDSFPYLYTNDEQSFTVLLTNNASHDISNFVLTIGDVFTQGWDDTFLDTEIIASAPNCTPTELSLRCVFDDVSAGQTVDLSFVLRYDRIGRYGLWRTHARSRGLTVVNVPPPEAEDYAAYVYHDVLTDSDGDSVSDFNENLVGTAPADGASTPGTAIIDLLALYPTGLIVQEGGGHLTRINHLVAFANQIYDDSGVGAQLRIVGYEEVAAQGPYVDTAEPLLKMRDQFEEYSELGQFRDDYGADLVANFLDDPIISDACGRADLGGSNNQGDMGWRTELYGFKESIHSVTVSRCASFVLAHEIGHNMGLMHDRQESTDGTFDFALGYATSGGVGTIMTNSGTSREMRFSSPLLDCSGQPCGVDRADLVNGADAVFALNTTRYQIAALKGSLVDTDGDGLIDDVDTDDDNDGVLDVDDAFPLDPTETTDTDRDGTGDFADSDDDNDQIPDIDEIAYGLNPLDASDANLDSDGDGRSNLEEYLAGTNLFFDDVPPDLVIQITHIIVNSTGPETSVDIGLVTAIDFRDGVIVPSVDNSGPFIPGRNVITWTATDLSGNTAAADQIVDVIPIVSFDEMQVVAEGASVLVNVSLNGSAVSYPVIVPYTISGDAEAPADHDLVAGDIILESGTGSQLSFNTVEDGTWEGVESVVLSMGTPSNAITGGFASHTVLIREENIVPTANIHVTQDNNARATVTADGGLVTLTAEVSDPNPDDQQTINWSETDSSLVPINGYQNSTFEFDPSSLSEGMYQISVVVTDDGEGQLSSQNNSVIKVVSNAPALSTNDSDGDGVNDIDEGFEDSDLDRVLNYLDSTTNEEQLNSGVGDAVIQTDPGLILRLGETAFASSDELSSSALVTMGDLMDHGGAAGGVGVNVEDNAYEYTTGLFDFEVTGLIPGNSARVVLPQTGAIPANAVYRKYIRDSGWSNFVINSNNTVHSTEGSLGICPVPGDSSYTSGLTEGHFCVQLEIQDGGPNDADKMQNGVVKDPGGVAVEVLPLPTVNAQKILPVNNSFSTGDGERVILGFVVDSDSTDAQVEELTVKLSGDLAGIDGPVRLYHDENANGIPEAPEFVSNGLPGSNTSEYQFTFTPIQLSPSSDLIFLITHQF